ncbi:hypothetical protein KUTeg_007788 [Tegillarca granosa]|uniref:Uncharacterized protein n=1 Tax=Tegillarca granosa TaxID=220873 RepID=A0ABQ9FE83_TEGGR|nr:hypothetical protein KUTeg_007788 [Tegillarca granosa]
MTYLYDLKCWQLSLVKVLDSKFGFVYIPKVFCFSRVKGLETNSCISYTEKKMAESKKVNFTVGDVSPDDVNGNQDKNSAGFDDSSHLHEQEMRDTVSESLQSKSESSLTSSSSASSNADHTASPRLNITTIFYKI